MNEISSFSLHDHPGPYEGWPDLTDLYFDGQPTGTSVEGYVIEKQFQRQHGYLLITSFDCPFEEANCFILLSDTFKIIAQLSLGAPYETFLLNNATAVSEHEVILDYAQLRRKLVIMENADGRATLGLIDLAHPRPSDLRR
jgi:hypothetical protein